jgi:uncharacterized membrane protein YhaH (DUF805 family)
VRWYLAVLRNYVGFSGRARRTEFWMFVLFNAIVVTVINLVGRHVFDTLIPGLIYTYAVLIPTLAVCVRRLHDTGNPGAWLLIVLIPVIGAIAFVVFAAWPGTVGANEYGPDTKRDSPALD